LRNYMFGVQKNHRLRLGVHRNYLVEAWGSQKLPGRGLGLRNYLLGVHRNYMLETFTTSGRPPCICISPPEQSALSVSGCGCRCRHDWACSYRLISLLFLCQSPYGLGLVLSAYRHMFLSSLLLSHSPHGNYLCLELSVTMPLHRQLQIIYTILSSVHLHSPLTG
jgi:hypothetical protein